MRERRIISGIIFTFIFACLLSILYLNMASVIANPDYKTVTLMLQNYALGNIEEGETKTYNKESLPCLATIMSISTSKAPVNLLLKTNLDTLKTNYATYNITIIFSTIPAGSERLNGEIACRLSLSSFENQTVNLDVAGTWRFEAEITTTTKSVSEDCPTTVTITITID